MMNQFEAEMQKLQEDCYCGYKDDVFGVFVKGKFYPIDDNDNVIIDFESGKSFTVDFGEQPIIFVDPNGKAH